MGSRPTYARPQRPNFPEALLALQLSNVERSSQDRELGRTAQASATGARRFSAGSTIAASRRATRSASSRYFTGGSTHGKASRSRNIAYGDLKEDRPGVWSFVPKKDLKPGEYGLYHGKSKTISVLYEFGIDK